MKSKKTWLHKMNYFIKNIGLKPRFLSDSTIQVFTHHNHYMFTIYWGKNTRDNWINTQYLFEFDLILNYNKELKQKLNG